jgi:hypothetical protein
MKKKLKQRAEGKGHSSSAQAVTPQQGSSASFLGSSLRFIRRFFRAILPKNKWLRRIVVTLVCTIVVALLGMYGIARWYIWTERNTPLTMGVSFIPDYASYLGVDPQATMDVLIKDVGVKQFRLTSYWSDIETSPGQYDFSTLDWEFAKADAAHATVNLTVGLRQPRWPECHAPSFYDTSKPEAEWYPHLESFMTAVVNRYKNNPALAGYQVENEYFLQGFGTCTNSDRTRLIDETNLVRALDPHHQIIIGRSNNALGWPVGAPTPDTFSISVYRRVWDAGVTHRYLEYPFPGWFYAFTAGWQKIFTGKDMIIGELQTEAWPPNGQTIPETSLAEQSKSIDAQRMQTTIQFGKASGMKTIDLWGAEYWYYRAQVLHDPSLLNVAQQAFKQ